LRSDSIIINLRRIGASCARRLADLGCSLALTYSSSASAVESLVSELRSLNPSIAISVHQCDVSSPLAITSLFERIAASHPDIPVSILISNAGYGKRITNIWDISLEEFMYMINVNLTASFLLVKGVVEGMKTQRWGRILFVSSIAAYGAGLNGCRMYLNFLRVVFFCLFPSLNTLFLFSSHLVIAYVFRSVTDRPRLCGV
jgi:3-oxoacyl-[acyl-carrier protein] reductase